MLMSATFPDRRCLIKQAVSINLRLEEGPLWVESPPKKKGSPCHRATSRRAASDLFANVCTTLRMLISVGLVLFSPWLFFLFFILFALASRDSYQWQRLDFAFKSELYIRRFSDSRRKTKMYAGHGELCKYLAT